jgi:2-oxoglutarate ferredoxin oxidoreductase subunit beta
MNQRDFDLGDIDIAWCPGCGNYSILNSLKQALIDLKITPESLVIVSGIGQAAKIPQYFKTNYFNGLHGRSLPPATAIKATNPRLTVISESGDGDMYGEGGNHFIHAIRRNPDITNIVHNNMVYGLTKGQASPTSQAGFKTPIQKDGVISKPFNPIAIAIASDASFVARAFAGDVEETKEILVKAIKHKGYALVDILQPCVSFNKINTYDWFKENTYYLKNSFNSNSQVEAFKKSIENQKIPLGVLYQNNNKNTFEENLKIYDASKTPLYQRPIDLKNLKKLIESMI